MRAVEIQPRKLVIFDIDDTLVHTQTTVQVVKDGRAVKALNSHDFTHYKLQPGEQFDFENFRNAQEFFNNSKPIIPMMNQLKQDITTGNKVVMVTARADFDDRELFLDTFRKYGVDMDRVHVYRAGNMTGKIQTEEKKKIIIRGLLDNGNYTKAIMYDDAVPNLTSFVELKDEYPRTKFYAWHVSLEGEASEYNRTNESLNELFDGGKDWKWTYQDKNQAEAKFTVGDVNYTFSAGQDPDEAPGDWDVEFAATQPLTSPSWGLTGTGNSAQVLGTVVEIMKSFLTSKKASIRRMTFAAKEDSRQGLYARMIKRLLPKWNLEQSGEAFVLTRPGGLVFWVYSVEAPYNKIPAVKVKANTAREAEQIVLTTVPEFKGADLMGMGASKNKPDLSETIVIETAMMGKIEDSGKIIRILKKAHTVPFSDEKNWLLVDMDPAKGNKGLGIKWIPADTRFEWVRPYRDSIDENIDNDAAKEYRAHLIRTLPKMMKLFANIGKGWIPSKEQMLNAVDTAYRVMKHTGDTKQAGKVLMDELNALYRMSKGKQDVAEGLASTLVSKIFFARSNKTPKGWSYDHVGFITQDGKQIQMSGHRGNDVYITNAVTDDPEFLKQNIKIMSLPKPVSVPTTNTVGAENCGTFVANVLQANGVKGIDTQKIYSVFKKPPEQTLPENFADGRNPQDKGDSARHGIPKHASLSGLDKIGHGSGRKAQLARWQANMRRGRNK